MATKKWRENDFWQTVADDSVITLWIKNFTEIALSRTISEMCIFAFYAKIQYGRQKMAGNHFWQTVVDNITHTLRVKHFDKIALCLTVSEINAFCIFINVKFQK